MAIINIKAHELIERLKQQFNSNIIMNWSNIHKCIFILMLTLCVNFLWLAWKVFILLQPTVWEWVSLPQVHLQIIFNASAILLLGSLTVFCYFIQHKSWANSILPHVVINIFISLMIADGFFIGIYSPITIFAFVSISGVGLIIFNGKMIYIPLFTAITIYLALLVCTFFHIIPYAPVFSQKLLTSEVQNNTFWVVTMLYFIAPIMIVCLILCEILLSQWRMRELMIKRLSELDPLTNLYNRRFFNEKFEQIQSEMQHYSIILVDIDHFKSINDQYGHHFGDEVLCKIAQLLLSQIRQSDTIARYGGEEFIIAMPNASLEVATNIAERCRIHIQNQMALPLEPERVVQLTASFGIASSQGKIQPEKIIQHADQALYEAKQHGRNQVRCYSASEASI